MIRVILLGATGRLGTAIQRYLPSDFALAATLSRPPVPSVEADLIIGASLGNPLPSALERRLPLLLATTGIPLPEIQEASRHLPLFYDNYSLGMAVMRSLVRETARLFPSEIDLIETHHNRKKDAPSGTALLLSDEIARFQAKPSIHSIRSGEIVGEHKVLFNTPEERIEIAHETHSRDTYAKGIYLAARFLVGKPSGLYSMQDLLAEMRSKPRQ